MHSPGFVAYWDSRHAALREVQQWEIWLCKPKVRIDPTTHQPIAPPQVPDLAQYMAPQGEEPRSGLAYQCWRLASGDAIAYDRLYRHTDAVEVWRLTAFQHADTIHADWSH